MKIGIKGVGTLGDSLWHTVACKKYKDICFEMHRDNQCRQVSTIFNGLAKVDFVENPSELLYKINKDKTHYAQRILNYLGDTENNCIPKVIIAENEIKWARNFLNKYQNPIVVINDNSGKNDPGNIRARYVCPPDAQMEYVASKLKELGYSVLQFGQSNNFSKLQNSIPILDLSIRDILACFSIIQFGYFPDSGLYHAMLSVGGRATVLHPPESINFGYIFEELHYLPHLWKNEEIRVNYIDYTKF